MTTDGVLALAIPLIALAMVAEYWLGLKQGQAVYRWPSLISDLSCGVASLVGKAVVGLSGVFAYYLVETHAGILDIQTSSIWAWVLGFLLMDLMLWWRHWACHRVGIFWALHAVHHQSPDLNIGTAIRVPWVQDLQIMPFIFVSALVGFPVEIFAVHTSLATLSALFTHTRVVGRLGPLEWFLVTPSHHRVHHACNGEYLDQNYGAVLIIWDKLFGTFKEETAECLYGHRNSTDEMCAFRSNARPWLELMGRASKAPTAWGRVETLFRPPSWNPVSRREDVPDLAAGLVGEHPLPERIGLPWLKMGALVGCALFACIPLAYPDWHWGVDVVFGAVVFVLLSWISRGRLEGARPAPALGSHSA